MIATLPREILLTRRVEFPAWVKRLGDPLRMFGHGAFVKPFAQPMGGAGVAAFAPTDIAWAQYFEIDTLSALANNDPVAAWADQSGNGRDITQGTGGLQPLYKTNIQNGLAGVLSDATDDTLDSTFTPSAGAVEVFLVLRTTGTFTNLARPFGFDGGVLFYYAGNPTEAGRFGVYMGNVGPVETPVDSIAINTSYIVRCLFNGASSEIQINNGTTYTGDAGAAGYGAMYLFSGSWGAYYFFEVGVSQGALSAGNRANMWTYLNTKYAVY